MIFSLSMSAAAEKVKDVAVDEVKRIEKLTNDAARSGAYLYPIRVCPQSIPDRHELFNADSGSRAYTTLLHTKIYGITSIC